MQYFPVGAADFSRKLAMGAAGGALPDPPGGAPLGGAPPLPAGPSAPPPMPHAFQQITQGGFGAPRPPMGPGAGMMPPGGMRPVGQMAMPNMTPPSGNMGAKTAVTHGAALFL